MRRGFDPSRALDRTSGGVSRSSSPRRAGQAEPPARGPAGGTSTGGEPAPVELPARGPRRWCSAAARTGRRGAGTSARRRTARHSRWARRALALTLAAATVLRAAGARATAGAPGVGAGRAGGPRARRRGGRRPRVLAAGAGGFRSRPGGRGRAPGRTGRSPRRARRSAQPSTPVRATVRVSISASRASEPSSSSTVASGSAAASAARPAACSALHAAIRSQRRVVAGVDRAVGQPGGAFGGLGVHRGQGLEHQRGVGVGGQDDGAVRPRRAAAGGRDAAVGQLLELVQPGAGEVQQRLPAGVTGEGELRLLGAALEPVERGRRAGRRSETATRVAIAVTAIAAPARPAVRPSAPAGRGRVLGPGGEDGAAREIGSGAGERTAAIATSRARVAACKAGSGSPSRCGASCWRRATTRSSRSRTLMSCLRSPCGRGGSPAHRPGAPRCTRSNDGTGDSVTAPTKLLGVISDRPGG